MCLVKMSLVQMSLEHELHESSEPNFESFIASRGILKLKDLIIWSMNASAHKDKMSQVLFFKNALINLQNLYFKTEGPDCIVLSDCIQLCLHSLNALK